MRLMKCLLNFEIINRLAIKPVGKANGLSFPSMKYHERTMLRARMYLKQIELRALCFIWNDIDVFI